MVGFIDLVYSGKWRYGGNVPTVIMLNGRKLPTVFVRNGRNVPTVIMLNGGEGEGTTGRR